MPADDLEARRWFRKRLKEIGEQYPELKTPSSKSGSTAELQRQEEDLERGEAC